MCPTHLFTTLELQNLSPKVPEQHKTRLSPDFDIIVKGPAGWQRKPILGSYVAHTKAVRILFYQLQLLTISHVGLLDPPIVCNVLPLRGHPIQVHVHLLGVVTSVLVNDALCLLNELLPRRWLPPIVQISLFYQKIDRI